LTKRGIAVVRSFLIGRSALLVEAVAVQQSGADRLEAVATPDPGSQLL
jgi:hypothetical protein